MDAADPFGFTALHKAVSSGHEGAVRVLIDAGGNLNKADPVDGMLATVPLRCPLSSGPHFLF